ncbi:hypothetical protein [Nocardiopsis aegyptia]|uniref:Uncharacterized protein n=1 Tax=Nocardiopsis aegyptia TaxID=220378 RepID=A0A7Z0EMZ5_9ACTN|nr:hypothetical protein [Nocardiopsis aegyptia]NYJ35122.1 hypothetical protein [Nocardiopsis aegyptia]
MERTNPAPVVWATAVWATAVACGVVETVLAVAEMVSEGEAVPWAGLALRLAVYTAAALVVAAFARGHRWARAVLAVGLGAVGLGTLVVPIAAALPDGTGVLAAMGYEHGPLYLVVRVAHIASVVAALVLSFTPAAGRGFARGPGTRPSSVADRPRDGGNGRRAAR